MDDVMQIVSIDRSDISTQIDNAIADGKRTVILSGPGGYGKTVIANEYASQRIDNVYFKMLTSESGDFINQLRGVLDEIKCYCNSEESLNRLAKICELTVKNETDIPNFCRLLYGILDHVFDKWIIIYDNVDRIRSAQAFLKLYVYSNSRDGNGIVLITSQITTWRMDALMHKKAAKVNVSLVPEDYAIEYLISAIPGISQESAVTLCNSCGRIALAMNQACATIVNRVALIGNIESAVQDFIKSVETNAGVWDSKMAHEHANIYKTTITALDYMRSDNNELGEKAYHTIAICSILPHTGVKEFMPIYVGIGGMNSYDIDTLSDIWELLKERGFINSDTSIYTMHPTTQNIILDIYKHTFPESYIVLLKNAVNSILSEIGYPNKYKGNPSQEQLSRLTRLFFILKNEVGNDNTDPLGDEELASFFKTICYVTAYNYYVSEDYDTAERYYKEAIRMCIIDDANAKIDRASYYMYIANGKRSMQQYDTALTAYKKALRECGSTSPSAVTTQKWAQTRFKILYNIGLLYEIMNDSSEAVNMYRNATQFAKDNDIPYYIASRCEGIVLRDLGQVREGFNLFMQGIKDAKDVACDEWDREQNDHIARSYNNIGLCYYAIGRYDKALESYNQASDYHKQNGDHNAWVEINIARSENAQGNTDSALEHLRVAVNFASQHNEEIIKIFDDMCHGTSPALAIRNKLPYYNYIYMTAAESFIICEKHNIAELFLNAASIMFGSYVKERISELIGISSIMGDADSIETIKTNVDKLLESGLNCSHIDCGHLFAIYSKYYMNIREISKSCVLAYAAYCLYNSRNCKRGIISSAIQLSEALYYHNPDLFGLIKKYVDVAEQQNSFTDPDFDSMTSHPIYGARIAEMKRLLASVQVG